MACRIFSCSLWYLVPWPGTEPRPPALGAWSLSHWTTREVPILFSITLQPLTLSHNWCHTLLIIVTIYLTTAIMGSQTVIILQSRIVEYWKWRICNKLDRRYSNSPASQKQIRPTSLDVSNISALLCFQQCKYVILHLQLGHKTAEGWSGFYYLCFLSAWHLECTP